MIETQDRVVQAEHHKSNIPSSRFNVSHDTVVD